MASEVLTLFLVPLLDIWKNFTSWVPGIFASLLFLLLGLVLARVVTSMVSRLLGRISLDKHTSLIGLNEIFTRVGFGKSPAHVINFVLYWSIILVFVMVAANILKLQALSDVLSRFLLFMPRMGVAILVMFGGLLFARLMHEVVSNSATSNNIHGGAHLANLTHTVIIIFAALMALEQLGIRMTMIESTINIILGSVGLAFALAVGLGAKDLVADYLRGVFQKEKK